MFIIKYDAEWFLINWYPSPSDGFMMKTMIRGWRYGGDRLAITKNQHAPNRYSKASIIEDNICKLSLCNSPWLTRYLSLYPTSTNYSWTKDKGKCSHFKMNISKQLLFCRKIANGTNPGETKRQDAVEVRRGSWQWKKIVKTDTPRVLSIDCVDH